VGIGGEGEGGRGEGAGCMGEGGGRSGVEYWQRYKPSVRVRQFPLVWYSHKRTLSCSPTDDDQKE